MQSDLDLASQMQSLLTDRLNENAVLLLGSLAAVLIGLLWLLWRSVRLARRQKQHIRHLESQLHGATVRRGYASEALAPLLDSFPVAVGREGTSTLFVGQPVDYIHFDERDGVTFIEIKSGGSQLSARQRRLRDLVDQGCVRWETMTIDSTTGRPD